MRLSSERTGPAGRPAGEGPRPARVWLALAASVAVLAAAVAIWRGTRATTPPPAPVALARGVLVLNASPWGRVASIVGEPSGLAYEAGGAVTPCRLTLPPGRWRVVVRAADGGEAAASVEVRSGVETPVHVDLPGFDVERAVGSLVSDGT